MDNTSSGYSGSTIYGYTGITITDGVGYITKKDGTTQTPITITDNKPLKARLPKLKEITDEGCHFYSSSVDYGTCSAWLTNGLQQYETYYPENENIIGVLGYWLLSSYSGDSNGARYVSYEGYAGWTATSADRAGVRPVITVLKDNLS